MPWVTLRSLPLAPRLTEDEQAPVGAAGEHAGEGRTTPGAEKRWARGEVIMEPQDAVQVVDLEALARHGVGSTAWAHQSMDLNVNLLVLAGRGQIGGHRNDEVDVLFVILAGDGTITVEENAYPVRAGHALVIPKGTRRAVSAGDSPLTYLTCHRRRGGLWPHGVPRPGESRPTAGQEQRQP